jgi:hypothetical protein
MLGVVIEISRYVNDANPGWVECRLTDAHGREWLFVEKVPIVTNECLDSQVCYPRPGVIACHVVERQEAGREIITIDTELPWHVEAITGDTRFDVRPQQRVEFDWGWAHS